MISDCKKSTCTIGAKKYSHILQIDTFNCYRYRLITIDIGLWLPPDPWECYRSTIDSWTLFCNKILSENFRTNFPSTFCRGASLPCAFCKSVSFPCRFCNVDEVSSGPVYLIPSWQEFCLGHRAKCLKRGWEINVWKRGVYTSHCVSLCHDEWRVAGFEHSLSRQRLL